MRVAFPLLIIAVVIVCFVVVDRIAKARMERQLREVETWPSLPIEERLQAHTNFTERFVKEDAKRFRNSVTFSTSVAAAGLLMIVWLNDTAEQSRDQSIENCRNFRTLLNIQIADLDADRRHATADQQALADAIESQDDNLENLPGYTNLPFSTQRFLQGMQGAQIAEAEAVLEGLESDIRRLRLREDAISGFANTLDCE